MVTFYESESAVKIFEKLKKGGMKMTFREQKGMCSKTANNCPLFVKKQTLIYYEWETISRFRVYVIFLRLQHLSQYTSQKINFQIFVENKLNFSKVSFFFLSLNRFTTVFHTKIIF